MMDTLISSKEVEKAYNRYQGNNITLLLPAGDSTDAALE